MAENKDLRQRIIGLGEHSFKKSYYPELQHKISELNLFKAVFDQVNDMILIINPSDGYIEYINDSAKKIFNFSLKHPNQYLTDIVSDKYWRIIKDIINENSQLLKEKEFKYKIELDNRLLYINNSVNLIESNNKKFCALVVRDITERITIEKKLIAAKEKAEEGTKLKSAFLANMSHEIRTPMNGILGFVSLLDETNVSEQNRKSFMSIIKSSCNDLLRIIDDILDISKIESGLVSLYKRKFSLNKVFNGLDEIYKLKIKALNKNITISFFKNLPDGDDLVFGDEVRIKQILRNLIENAIKFTKEGNVKVSYIIVENVLKFSVIDTGIGIKDDKLTIIFERFRQSDDIADRHFGGTGLGLSICKGLLDLMNGKIYVESDYGIGSKFYFEIPIDIDLPT